MGLFQNIFGPIVEDPNVPLDSIDVVAFDTMGTLVQRTPHSKDGKSYVADDTIVPVFKTLKDLFAQMGMREPVIISGDAVEAERALQLAGVQHDRPVIDKMLFYNSVGNSGHKVLVFDDEVLSAIEADVHIDPTRKKIREYFAPQNFKPA